jgi:hypothetical protein
MEVKSVQGVAARTQLTVGKARDRQFSRSRKKTTISRYLANSGNTACQFNTSDTRIEAAH